MTVGAVRVRHALPVAIVLAAGTWAILLYLSRRFDFYYDDWDFVLGSPHWTLRDYFLPHNEHWWMLGAVVYKLLFTLFGARSYTPFMATVLALHAAAAILLFLIIRGRSGDVPALVASVMLLGLGTGFENILWAFQIGFLGSIDLGLAAILLLERDGASAVRQAVASGLLVLGMTSSGLGLFFVAAIAGDLALNRARRHYLWVIAAPLLAYATWSATFGRHSLSVTRGASPFSPAAFLSLRSYVPYGIGRAVAALFGGVASEWHLLGLAALVAILAVSWTYRRFQVDSRVAGAGFALLVMFGATGLVRSELGDVQAGSPRYVYNAAIFLLPILASVVAPLGWRNAWRIPLGLLVAFALAQNATFLVKAAHAKNDLFALQDRELETAWIFRDAPGVDPNATIDPVLMPQVTVERYVDARLHLGTNLPSPNSVAGLEPGAVDNAMNHIFQPQVTDAPEQASSCIDQPLADAQVAPGGTLTVRSDQPGHVAIWIWYVGHAGELPTLESALPPDQQLVIHMPDTGRSGNWHLKVQLPAYSSGSACSSGR